MKELLRVVIASSCVALVLGGFRTVVAEPEPAKALRICSQNLHNYGAVVAPSKAKGKRSRKKRQSAEEQLIERFAVARCDVIAVQEVTGTTKKESLKILRRLAGNTAKSLRRPVQALVADRGDGRIRNGFLVASDRVEMLSVKSFSDVDLPRLQRLGPSRVFTRSPLLGRLRFAQQDLLVVNIHLKSKVDAWRDPTETSYEAQRMEAAEALRRLMLAEQIVGTTRLPVLIVGDRNTDSGSAASEVLAGSRELSDFRSPEHCRLNNELEPLCPKALPPRKPAFVDMIAAFNSQTTASPVKSYRYRGELSALDSIYLSAESLPLAGGTNPRVGSEGVFGKGSDHKLIWIELRF